MNLYIRYARISIKNSPQFNCHFSHKPRTSQSIKKNRNSLFSEYTVFHKFSTENTIVFHRLLMLTVYEITDTNCDLADLHLKPVENFYLVLRDLVIGERQEGGSNAMHMSDTVQQQIPPRLLIPLCDTVIHKL